MCFSGRGIQYGDDTCNHLRLTRSHCGLLLHHVLLCSRRRVGSRNSWSLPDIFGAPTAIGKMKTSLLCDVSTSFASIRGLLTRPCLPIPQCLQPTYLLSKSSPRLMHIREIFHVKRNRIIFNHRPKRNHWAFKNGSPNPLSSGVLLVCQEVLNISQIAIAFHRLRPPLFIQARLQQ